MSQLALGLPPLDRDPALVHIEVAGQDAARCALAAWRQWPGQVLVLTGPKGSGKSHLAALWARDVDAGAIAADRIGAQGRAPIVIEDADRGDLDERGLLALLEVARAGSAGPVLLTARAVPATWTVRLPDLASRLALSPTVAIADPTDADLGAVFAKHVADRGAEASPALVDYVVRRIERSYEAAQAAAEALDRAALERKQRITRKLAAEVLGEPQGGAEAIDER